MFTFHSQLNEGVGYSACTPPFLLPLLLVHCYGVSLRLMIWSKGACKAIFCPAPDLQYGIFDSSDDLGLRYGIFNSSDDLVERSMQSYILSGSRITIWDL